MSNYEDILDLCPGSWTVAEDRIAEHLDWLGDIDLAEPDWSFDLLRIYRRKSDGVYLWATDSGCSCPSPFEDIPIKEFAEANSAAALLSAVDETLRTYGNSSYRGAVSYVDLRSQVRKVLKGEAAA